MEKSSLKRKAKSLAIARRQVREYMRREANRSGVVAELASRKTAALENTTRLAKEETARTYLALAKARYFERWGLIDRLRYLFFPKSVVGEWSGRNHAA
jgi:hypothetical protein